MAAPVGNRFWELRSKHGRDKLFETPELMWEAACEYFQWCLDNPWTKTEQSKLPPKPIKNEDGQIIGFTPNIVELPTATPFTIHGLCSYLDCNTGYFRQFKTNLKEKDKDFSAVITRIEETIYRQKFEGAAVGAFNANIIARDLGLKDVSDITTGGEKLNNDVDYSKLSDSVLLAIIEAGKKDGSD